MKLAIDVALEYWLAEPADVLLQLEVAAMLDQVLLSSALTVSSDEPLRAVPGEDAIGQRTLALAAGQFQARYIAEVSIDRSPVDLAAQPATPARYLPGLVVPYVMPSRYCQSDRFQSFVEHEFGGTEGGPRVVAIRDWIAREIDYVTGTSNGDTSAADTFVSRCGVCRDFAHLMATLARASSIPARLVSAYSADVTPPDFHALVEVWLDGGWHPVDATGMTKPEDIARIVVGRDATDIAFMTIFGTAEIRAQTVQVTRIA